MYSLVISFSISQIIQSVFIAWLWWKMHMNSPLLLEYNMDDYPIAYPTAPKSYDG